MTGRSDQVPLVGRDHAVAEINDAWRRLCAAPANGPVVALVTGEAGIGKTRLLSEAIDQLIPAADVVLRATARATAPAPYDWTASAFARHPEPPGLPPGIYQRLLQQPHSLAPAVDDATTLLEIPPLPEGALLRLAVQAVRSIVGTGPAVVLVDDLHWLDTESLTLVGELATSVNLPVLLAVASRDAAEANFPDTAARVLSRLATRASTTGAVRLQLSELPLNDVTSLLEQLTGARIAPVVARSVHRRTSGNPFWITELAAAQPASPTLSTLADAPLPAHLAALVCSRLAGADTHVWTVARTAALLGEDVLVSDLAEVSETGDIDRAVHSLVSAGVLLPDGPHGVRFRHALAREAIGSTVLPAEASAIHRRAVLAAERRGDTVAVAHHAHASGDSQTTVSAALRAATIQLEHGHADSALELAELGLRCAATHPELLSLAARAAQRSGHLDAAVRHTEKLLENTTDIRTRIAAYHQLSDVAWRAGRTTDQWGNLNRAEELAAEVPSTTERQLERLLCLVARSRALVRAEQHDAVLQVNDAARIALAEVATHTWPPDVDVGDIELALTIDRGTTLSTIGANDEGDRLLFDAWESAQAAHNTEAKIRAVNNLLTLRKHRLSEPEGWALFERAVTTVGPTGMIFDGGKITRSGIDLAILHGDQARAWQLLEQRLPVETDPVEQLVLGAKAGLLALERDDDGVTPHWTDRWQREAPEVDQFWARKYPALLAVARAARFGPPAQTLQALRTYQRRFNSATHHLREHRVAETALWGLTGGVDPDDIRSFITGCLPSGFTSRSAAAWIECAIREAEGDHVGVFQLADEALLNQYTTAHLRADVRQQQARAAIELGEAEVALRHARSAVELLRRWPGWRQRKADDLLGRLGGASLLTSREAEVLRLVADGFSNRQVARALSISERTVEVHVSRILAKTQTRSRTEASRWALHHLP